MYQSLHHPSYSVISMWLFDTHISRHESHDFSSWIYFTLFGCKASSISSQDPRCPGRKAPLGSNETVSLEDTVFDLSIDNVNSYNGWIHRIRILSPCCRDYRIPRVAVKKERGRDMRFRLTT